MSDAAIYSAHAADYETQGNNYLHQVANTILQHFTRIPPALFTPAEVAAIKKLIEKAESQFRQAARAHTTAAEKYKDDSKYHEAGMEYRSASNDAKAVAQLNISTGELVEAEKYMKMTYSLAMDERAAFHQSYTNTGDANDRHASEASESKLRDLRQTYGPGGTAGTNFTLP